VARYRERKKMTPDKYLYNLRRKLYANEKARLKRRGEWPEKKLETITALNLQMMLEKKRVIGYDDYNFQRMIRGEIP